MSFMRPRSLPIRPSRKDTVWPVGSRLYVNCASDENRGVGLTATADDGSVHVMSLTDGVEVEVRAWRPRGAAGTRYCVSACAEGVSGWLASGALRATRVAAPPAERPPAPPLAPQAAHGRRFGEGR